MREDQHAERARRLDEAGGGDRLARRGRMAEAVAANRAGILLGGELPSRLVARPRPRRASRRRPRPRRPRGRPPRRPRGRCRCRSSSSSRWVAAISSVSIPASASIWWRRSGRAGGGVRLRVGEHALEPEHEPVAHLPAARSGRVRPASISAIASSSARRRAVPGASTAARILAVAEERLARPRFGAVCGGGKWICRLGEDGRLSGFLHVRSTSVRAANLERWSAR